MIPRCSPKDCLLDVRSAEEFQEGHLEGAQNVAYDRVYEEAHRLAEYERIFIYCRTGRRAYEAADVLEQLGVKELWVVEQGGMEQFK